MKKLNVILLVIVMASLMALAIIVSAQESMEKTDKGMDVKAPMRPMMGWGMGRMMDRPGMAGMGDMGGGGMRGMGGMRGQGRMMPPMQGFGRMMGPMGMMPFLTDKLNLSKEQRDEIDQIFVRHRKDMIKNNADRELALVEFESLMKEEDPDLGVVKERVQDIANLEAEMKFSRIKTWTDTKNVLTPEQKETLKNLKKTMAENRPQPRDRKDRAVKPGRPDPNPGPRR